MNKERWKYYEETEEDKSRRYAIPKEDRLVSAIDYISGRAHYCVVILHKGVIYMRDNLAMVAVIILMVSVWTSGYLAHSGRGVLAILVILGGFLVGAILDRQSHDA